MKRSLFVLALVAAMLVAAPFARATVIEFHATLNGPSESPPNASPGTGFAVVDLDTVLNTLQVHIVFSGLLGTTTASHIHCCTALPLTGTAGVATLIPAFPGFPLGVTSGVDDAILNLNLASSYNPAFIGTFLGTPAQQLAAAEAAFIAGLESDKTYLNIHTSVVPGGEIRGFLVPAAVPEPGTLALLALGLGAGLVSLRRKRA